MAIYTLQKKRIFLILLLLFSLSAYGRQTDENHKKRIDSLVRVAGGLWDRDIDSAQSIARSMLQYSEEHNFLRGIGQAHGTLAAIASYKGEEGFSLWHSQQALRVFDSIDNQILANKIRLNIGVSFFEEGEYQEALLQTNEALTFFLSQNDSSALASTYISLGLIYSELNADFAQKDTLLIKAAQFSRAISDTLYLSNALSLRADLFIDNNYNLSEAGEMIRESFQLLNHYEEKEYLLSGYNYYVLSKLWERQKAYTQALVYNDSAIRHYGMHEYLMGLKRSYENRASIYAKMGNYKDAYLSRIILGEYKDSLKQKRKKTQFDRLQIEYETNRVRAEKERAEAKAKIAMLESEKSSTYLLGTVILSALILLSVLFYLGRLKNLKKSEQLALELNALDLEKQRTESELKAIKSQMSPHFIFNALNSVQDYIIGNKKQEASEYLGSFADLIRSYLVQSDSEYIHLSEEIKSLEIYLSLETLRFEEGFKYTIKADQTLMQADYAIPTMLIQPFVENAIAHGLLHKEGERNLFLTFSKGKGNTLSCTIEDNGVGRKSTFEIQYLPKKKHQSFSSRAIKERLRLFNKNTEDQVGFEIIDLRDGEEVLGTKVIVDIPIIDI